MALALAPTERAQLRAQVRAARDRVATAETTLRNAANVIVNIDAAALEARAYAEAEERAREEKDKKDGGGSKRRSGKDGGSEGGSGNGGSDGGSGKKKS